ncbi:MAG: hypothetical protein WC406_04435 [Methanoregula sp.]
MQGSILIFVTLEDLVHCRLTPSGTGLQPVGHPTGSLQDSHPME